MLYSLKALKILISMEANIFTFHLIHEKSSTIFHQINAMATFFKLIVYMWESSRGGGQFAGLDYNIWVGCSLEKRQRVMKGQSGISSRI